METAKRVDKEEKRNGSKILRQRSTDGQTDKIANVKSKTDATEVKGLLDQEKSKERKKYVFAFLPKIPLSKCL